MSTKDQTRITRPARRRASGDVSRAHDAAWPYGHARSAQRRYARGRVFRGASGGEKDRAWTYLPYGPYADPAVFKADIATKAQLNDALFFAILDNSTGEAVGTPGLSPHRADAPCDRGWAHFVYPLHAAHDRRTEAQYLFAAVFDALGYRRYEWRCDDLYATSKRAAARFGFTFEGVFRQHMIIKGRNRDTAWFSMLDVEWPARRAAFERWLDPANFDPEGRQKVSLSEPECGIKRRHVGVQVDRRSPDLSATRDPSNCAATVGARSVRFTSTRPVSAQGRSSRLDLCPLLALPSCFKTNHSTRVWSHSYRLPASGLRSLPPRRERRCRWAPCAVE